MRTEFVNVHGETLAIDEDRGGLTFEIQAEATAECGLDSFEIGTQNTKIRFAKHEVPMIQRALERLGKALP